jgi:hypothetical protein
VSVHDRRREVVKQRGRSFYPVKYYRVWYLEITWLQRTDARDRDSDCQDGLLKVNDSNMNEVVRLLGTGFWLLCQNISGFFDTVPLLLMDRSIRLFLHFTLLTAQAAKALPLL